MQSVKRTWTGSAFPTRRVLEVSWSWALSLVCEGALNFMEGKVRITHPIPGVERKEKKKKK
jgi:hypothetical protein